MDGVEEFIDEANKLCPRLGMSGRHRCRVCCNFNLMAGKILGCGEAICHHEAGWRALWTSGFKRTWYKAANGICPGITIGRGKDDHPQKVYGV